MLRPAAVTKLGRSIFLTEGFTPRRGRRVLPVTLGHHHKPFGSARTARGLRALDLAGALHALWRTERREAREKGVDQDRRTICDPTQWRVLRRKRGLERVRVLHNVSRAAREGTCPAGTEYCRRRSGRRLRNGIRAFRAPWYPTKPPLALRRATQARCVVSARSTSGSIRAFRWMPPLGGDRLTSGPSTATTLAPSVLGVSGRVLAARRAPPRVGARTCSICARVALRRVVPCAAPEALGGPWSLGTCPLCTLSGGGRSTGCTATARAREDPARRTGPTREGVTAPPARSPRCATGSH